MFNILDTFSTRLVRLYYLACWETDDKDGMVVSKNILNLRGYQAMTNKEYNGWYNYETWMVNLWMDNNQGSHEMWREIARESIDADEGQTGFYLRTS